MGALFFSINAAVAEELFLCDDGRGSKEYRTTGIEKGCRKIDLPGLTTIPPLKKHKPGTVVIGMTKREAKKSVGAPLQVKRTETRRGVVEVWTYGNNKKLTFANGSLEVIEN